MVLAGCAQSGDATVERSSTAVTDPTSTAQQGPVYASATSHRVGTRIVHRLEAGNCVTYVPPPQPYAIRPDGTRMLPHEIIRPKAGEAHRLFLNFEGGTLTSTWQDDPDGMESSVVAMNGLSSVTIPAFDHTPHIQGTLDTREKVIEAIRQWVQYFYAHNDLEVVSQRPAAGSAYGMMMVGGVPGDAGEGGSTLGVSPADCDKYERNISYTFSAHQGHGDMEVLVQTIVHEAGHAYGLMHISDDQSIMYWQNTGPGAHWGSGSTTDSAGCDGTGQQDSFETLKEHVGERDDTTPPWVEIYKPGDEAIVPNAFQALVHGTDNVVLWSVEFFVDGASIRKETLPVFAFQVSDLPEGAHELWAIGEDAHGNTFTSASVDVTVEANCGALAECTEGLGGVGELCAGGGDCMTGLCAQDAMGVSVCSRDCDIDDPCPWGTECTPAESGDGSAVDFYCAGGPAPVTLLGGGGGSDYMLSGCATARDGAPLGTLFVLLLCALLALFRRRR